MLSKTDSNVQYRYSTPSVSGNTSEYFRDVLGEPMDFSSSTEGWTATGSSTISQSNGMLKDIVSTAYTGVTYKTPNFINKEVYTNISFSVYCTSSVSIYVYTEFISGGSAYGLADKSFSCPTTATTENLLLSAFTGTITTESISFNVLSIKASASTTFYLDNIQLLGSYNYATMNQYPNNWGFDQSKEYFYNQLGNISNFQDGTTENYTSNAKSSIISYQPLAGSINFGTSSLANNGVLNSNILTSPVNSYINKSSTYSVSGSATLTGADNPSLALQYYDGTSWTSLAFQYFTGQSVTGSPTFPSSGTLSSANLYSNYDAIAPSGSTIFQNSGVYSVTGSFTYIGTGITYANLYHHDGSGSTLGSLAAQQTINLGTMSGSISFSVITFSSGTTETSSVTNSVGAVYKVGTVGVTVTASEAGQTLSTATLTFYVSTDGGSSWTSLGSHTWDNGAGSSSHTFSDTATRTTSGALEYKLVGSTTGTGSSLSVSSISSSQASYYGYVSNSLSLSYNPSNYISTSYELGYALTESGSVYSATVSSVAVTDSTTYLAVQPITLSLSDSSSFVTYNNSIQYRLKLINMPTSTSVFTINSISSTQASYNYFYYSYFTPVEQNINSEYLSTQVQSPSTQLNFTRTSLNIDTSTYKYFLLDLNASSALSNMTLYDQSGDQLCQVTSSFSANQWGLETCTLATGYTITSLIIQFQYANVSSLTLFWNFIGIYDSSLGNIESWNPSSSANLYNYVDPQGYLVNHITTSTSDNIHVSSLSIDTSIYRYLTIRIKADSSINRDFQLFANNLAISSLITVSSSFQTFTFDLESNNNWNGIINILQIYFKNSTNGYPDLNSVFTINYILLTAGPQQQQPFQIGFENPNTFQTTFNLTQVFFNSTYFRWEAFLYDEYGNIAAYYYSSNQTVTDITSYYRGKITYQILQSTLSIELLTDGQTRIFTASYPDDFTILNQLNTLFQTNNAPQLFFASSTPAISFDSAYLDYINAPYQTAQWEEVQNNGGFQSTSALQTVAIPASGNPYSEFRLDTPLLDAVSGDLNYIGQNTSISHTYSADYSFTIDTVNPTTGALNQIFVIDELEYGSGPNCLYQIAVGTDLLQIDPITHKTEPDYAVTQACTKNALATFSFSTNNLRQSYSAQVRYFPDSNNTVNYFDKSVNYNQSIVYGSGYSNEFVLDTFVSITYSSSDAGQAVFRLDNFRFTTKDIFQNIVNAVNNLGNTIAQGIASIFNPFFDLFKKLIIWLGGIMQNVVAVPIVAALASVGTTIISGITGSLSPLLTDINTALGPLSTLATDITGPINSAIGAIAGDIWDVLTSNFSTYVNPLIDQFFYYMGTIIGTINTEVLQPLAALLFSGVGWFWNNVVLPILTFTGTLWNTFTGYIWQVVNSAWLWLLGIVNLTALYNQLVTIFNWVLGLTNIGVFYVTWILLVITISFPFFMSLTDKNILLHIKEVWGMDATFGLGILGFKLHVPLVVVTLTLILINPTFVNALFPFLPW